MSAVWRPCDSMRRSRGPPSTPSCHAGPSTLPVCPGAVAGAGRRPHNSSGRSSLAAAANKARLAEIGLVQTVQAIASVQTEQARVRRAAKAASRAARKAAGTAPAGRVRRCAALHRCFAALSTNSEVQYDVWLRLPALAAHRQ